MKNIIYISGLILIILCLAAYNNRPLPNTFLIPSDYEGTLRIVFEEKCGITPEAENGRQILKFQKNGLLILNTEFNYGINSDNDYYLVDIKGNRTKVTQISSFKDRVNKMPAIVVGGVGVSSSVVNSVNSNITVVAGGATYMDFNLYNKDTIEIINSVASQKLDSLTNAAVNGCRIQIGLQ